MEEKFEKLWLDFSKTFVWISFYFDVFLIHFKTPQFVILMSFVGRPQTVPKLSRFSKVSVPFTTLPITMRSSSRLEFASKLTVILGPIKSSFVTIETEPTGKFRLLGNFIWNFQSNLCSNSSTFYIFQGSPKAHSQQKNFPRIPCNFSCKDLRHNDQRSLICPYRAWWICSREWGRYRRTAW